MLLVFVGVFFATAVGLLWADRIDHGNDSAVEHLRTGSAGVARDVLRSASAGGSQMLAWLMAAGAALLLFVLVIAAVYLVALVWSYFD